MSQMDRVAPFKRDFVVTLIPQIGKTSFSKIVRSEAVNSVGRLTGVAVTTTLNLGGILRLVSGDDESLTKLGWISHGDFVFYGKPADLWKEHNWLIDTEDASTYEVVHVEKEGFTGDDPSIILAKLEKVY